MTTHYEVLRPVTQADLDTNPALEEILKMIPSDGYVTFEALRHVKNKRAARGLKHACSIGVLKRVLPHERILKLDSVRFWNGELDKSGHKNTTPTMDTRQMYLRVLSKFDEWLPGRKFRSYEDSSGGMPIQKSFANVDELLKYCESSDLRGPKTAQRAIREYRTGLKENGASTSVHTVARSAIKSYFVTHDVALNLPNPKKKRSERTPDDGTYMTLKDVYKMLQNGKPSIMMRAIILIMLQSGMDVSTLTDRFNHEGYPQLVRYFKTAKHELWDTARCPVPIKLVRVKTSMPYTTFLDHDAIVQLREYLTWKETAYGKQDETKPLFLTKQNNPIRATWVSKCCSKIAVCAGIQEKVSQRMFKMRAHRFRHLLKSTLNASDAASYVGNHILGHAPRDPYEMQAILYPDVMRAEYAKASSSLNIISKVESNLNSPKNLESQEARIRELEDEIAKSKTYNAEIALLERRHQQSMQEMYKVIESLKEKIDSLQRDAMDRA